METLATGFEGNLTPPQAAALDELRTRITKSTEYSADYANEPNGDRFLLAYLRASMKDKSGARIFRVDAAEERIHKTFDFRRKYNLLEIQNWVTSESKQTPEGYESFLKAYPHVDVVNESTGVLIRFNRFGRWITTVNPSMLTTEQWVRCLAYEGFYTQHELRKLSERLGREISTYIVAGDASGLSIMSTMTKNSFISFFSSVAGDHFPESLGATYLFNAPWFFPKAFEIVKPFLDKDTVSKFRVYKGCPREEFLSLVDASQLPKEFGGTHPTLTLNQVQ